MKNTVPARETAKAVSPAAFTAPSSISRESPDSPAPCALVSPRIRRPVARPTLPLTEAVFFEAAATPSAPTFDAWPTFLLALPNFPRASLNRSPADFPAGL